MVVDQATQSDPDDESRDALDKIVRDEDLERSEMNPADRRRGELDKGDGGEDASLDESGAEDPKAH